MAFETFDLGRIIATAEGIKGMRRDAENDKLRQAYIGEQIAGAQQNRQQQAAEFDQNNQLRMSRMNYLAAQAVVNSPDPVAAARELAPEMISAFEKQHGAGTFERLPREVVKQIATMGMEKSASAAGINLRPDPNVAAQQQFAREMDATNFTQQKQLAGMQFGQQKQLLGMQREMTPYQQEQLALDREQLEAQRSGVTKPPTGYRYTADGNLQFIPGGPEDPSVKKNAGQQSMNTAYETYKVARDGLLQGLESTETGALIGRAPAFTSAQQTAEGAVAAMAPVLKGIFRTAGEGTFTDKDQELLLAMVPTRKDEPAARRAKIQNIDAIIRAKLGVNEQSTQPQQAPTATGPNGQKLILQNGQWVPLGG